MKPSRHKLTRRQVLEQWWLLPVGATIGAFGLMGWYASRVTFGKRAPGAPKFVSGLPLKVAALSDLPGDWAQQAFTYDGRPCIALRLPRSVPGSVMVAGAHYAAYSRVCTHLGCAVNLIRDPEVLAFSFNYRPPDSSPQLGCPCHYSVFSPLRSGAAVFGKARSPLPRVRLSRRGTELWATGIEAAPELET